ncbi:hypothetical protein [Rhodococcus daqingensis]|uniref:Uncharacterized protein n=1 Tax=Rhodococcus daqingensis TaxID=2479363 RepID=A0ABW2S5G5_9NOCA
MQTDDTGTGPAPDGLDAFFAAELGEDHVIVDTPNPQWDPAIHPENIEIVEDDLLAGFEE